MLPRLSSGLGSVIPPPGASPQGGLGWTRPPTFTVYCSLSAVTHDPFHASMLRPASQAGPMHESAGVGEVS